MRLLILENANKVAEYAANYVMKKINQFDPGPERYFVLGLPTGSTPLKMYKKLIESYQTGLVSFRYVKTFNMDEYIGLPMEHPQSYHTYMYYNFFSQIDIDPENVYILNGMARDLKAECDSFEKKISDAGGIRLIVGGVGENGHIAFNEPGSSFCSRTRVVSLSSETTEANSRFFDDSITEVPKLALTMGIGTIMDTDEVLILATGCRKSLALKRAFEEGVSVASPLSALQMHPMATVVCDEDATLELKVKTVKHYKEDARVRERVTV